MPNLSRDALGRNAGPSAPCPPVASHPGHRLVEQQHVWGAATRARASSTRFCGCRRAASPTRRSRDRRPGGGTSRTSSARARVIVAFAPGTRPKPTICSAQSRRGCAATRPGPSRHCRADTQALEQREVLEGPLDAEAREVPRPRGYSRMATIAHRAGVGAVETGHQVDQGALASAVGPDDGHDLPRPDEEIDVLQCRDTAEGLRQAAERQNRVVVRVRHDRRDQRLGHQLADKPSNAPTGMMSVPIANRPSLARTGVSGL